MKKNSNHKITHEERVEMVDLKTSLRIQGEKMIALAESLEKIIPKNKWNAEQWDQFLTAQGIIHKRRSP